MSFVPSLMVMPTRSILSSREHDFPSFDTVQQCG